MSVLRHLKDRMVSLKRELAVLYLCFRDPDTPALARLVMLLVLAYALSPVDLIPDFIPVLGYLDDLLIVPSGIRLALRLIPREVYNRHREAVGSRVSDPGLARVGTILVIALWALFVVLIFRGFLARD